MPDCIVHIGWHKTGTTALQGFLHGHADALLRAGFRYPTFMANHSNVLVAAMVDPDRPTYAEHFVPATKGFEAHSRRSAAAQITADILTAHDDKTLVLSAEDLCLLEREDIARLATALQAGFDRVRVVAYVRNHLDYARSALQQLLRMGYQVQDTLPDVRPVQGLVVLGVVPHYARRLDMWRAAFGAASVNVYDYDAVMATGQPIQQHFCDVCLRPGLFSTLAAAGNETLRANVAFSQPAGYLLNAMNGRQPLLRHGVPNPGVVFNRQSWLSNVSGPALQLPSEMQPMIAEASAADAEEFARLDKKSGASVTGTAFGQSAEQLFSGNQLLDDLAVTLDRTITAATVNLAREKFFSSLPRLQKPGWRAAAVAQMHVALFLMADPPRLVSCGLALFAAGETDLAVAYANKAALFGETSAGLQDLQSRLAGSQRGKSGSP